MNLSKMRFPRILLAAKPDLQELARDVRLLTQTLQERDDEIRQVINHNDRNAAKKIRSWMLW